MTFGRLIKNNTMNSKTFRLYNRFITYWFIYAFFLTTKPYYM